MLTFGLVYKLSVVLTLLMRIGVVSAQTLSKKRKYALLIIVIVAVVISVTPDLMTQFLFVGPIYLIYEISIWIGFIVARRRKRETSAKGGLA